MLPNISPNGTSFGRAGAYHLHDKSAPTAHRLLFAATRNLANDDAHLALHEMHRTASDAPLAKQFSGASPAGRKNFAPVKTISLAWAPHEKPTRQHMIAAADDFLLTMGWQHHQAVFAAHSDTAHPHLHIILNRINPLSGKTLNDWQDKKRAQQWAHDFELRRGAILCPARLHPHTSAGLPHASAKLLAQHSDRPRLSRAVRRQFRQSWARYFHRQRQLNQAFNRRAGITRSAAVSQAREGDHAAAAATLRSFSKTHAAGQRQLKTHRRILRLAQLRFIRQLLQKFPTPDLRTQRKQLLAQQAGAFAALRARPSGHPAEIAQSEIALEFAHRWAEIRKGPTHLRAAASAALAAEQHAALQNRTAHHIARHAAERRSAFGELSQRHKTQRRALTKPPREARAQAFSTRRPPALN